MFFVINLYGLERRELISSWGVTALISLYIVLVFTLNQGKMSPSGLYNNENEPIGGEEFRQVVLNQYKDLCVYAYRYVHDSDLAKDIVQEVLISLWNDREKVRNKSAIASYLRTAIKNQALNIKRRSKHQRDLDQILLFPQQESILSESPAVYDQLSFENLRNDYEKAVAELPVQRKTIFEMSRLQQMSHKEIAMELGISPKTVETQIYRSLAFLKDKLRNYL